MTFVKINETLYPAIINGKITDYDWDNRESKSITIDMDYVLANEIFVNGLKWSIIQRNEIPVFGENGENGTIASVEANDTEFDNAEYNLAGDITDHRDGTITIKMGKLTDLEEAYEIMLGGI